MTIAQVADKYGITPDTLRYYERVGLIPSVTRSAGGIRNYGEEECNWVEFIVCMRGAGIEVDALIRYVSLFKVGNGTLKERKNILIEQRDKLARRVEELEKTLARLDKKIENYESVLIPAQEKLMKKGEKNG